MRIGRPGALGPPHARVGVDGDHEPVAEAAGLFEAAQMAAMEQVEAAVGEDDPEALPVRASDTSGESVEGQDLVARAQRAHLSPSSGSRLNKYWSTFIGVLMALGTAVRKVSRGSASISGAPIAPSTLK